MKIKSLCIWLLCVISVQTFSQQAILQTSIPISKGTYSSVELIQNIQRSSGIQFSYKSKLLLEHEKKVLISSLVLQDILLAITDGNDMDFVVINGVVVIKTKKEIQKIIQKTYNANPSAQIEYVKKIQEKKVVEPEYIILSGKIKQAVSGELVSGALVIIDSLNIQIQSNEYGFFSCKVPQGSHVLRVVHPSNYMHEISIETNKQNFVEIETTSKQTELTSAKAAVQVPSLSNKTKLHEVKLQPTMKIPQSISLQDPLKEMGKVPGIQFINDLSSNVLVRGGTTYQNLVLIDDAPLFNPTHLFGLYSTCIPYSVKDVTIYKGDAPAQFGGRVSSVIDIRLREANEQNIGGYIEYSPVVTTLTIETPIVKQKAAVVGYIRKSNLRWLMKDNAGKALYSFYDAQLKFHMHTAKRHHLYYSFYSGNDVYNVSAQKLDEFGITWGNIAHAVRWNYIISPRVFSNLTLYSGTYNYYLYVPHNTIDYWNSHIISNGIKQDFTIFAGVDNTVRFGFELSGMQSNPGNLHYSDSSAVMSQLYTNPVALGMAVLYASHELKVLQKVSLVYGFRLPMSRNNGPAVQYVFEQDAVKDTLTFSENQTYNPRIHIEPKFQLQYSHTPYVMFYCKGMQTTQFVHGLSNSETNITSLDIWMPTTVNLHPQKSRLYSVGFNYTGFAPTIMIQSELYYKRMLHQWYPNDHARMLLNPYIEGQMIDTRVINKGIETMIQYKGEKLSTWLSYTYTQSKRLFNNQSISTAADRPHDISIGTSWKLVPKIMLEIEWNYMSGLLQTIPNAYYTANGIQVPYYESKYNSRLPSYHTLDVSAQFHLYKQVQSPWKHIITLQIYNVYARKNAFSYTYNKIEENNEYVIPTNVSTNAQYISTMLYAGTVIPMISYAIKFK